MQKNEIVIYFRKRDGMILGCESAGEQVISVSYMTVAMPNAKSGQSGQITAAIKLINSVDTCLDMQASTIKQGTIRHAF